MLNQQLIRQHNLRRVFHLILLHAPVSRIALAQMTKLSKTTISALVDELIARGYVVDEGSVHTGRQGRKPSILRVNSDGNVVAVINWHIESLEISLVDLAGAVVYYDTLPMRRDENFPARIRGAYETALRPAAGSRRILGFCLIVPSMLDPRHRRMVSTTLPVPIESDIINDVCALFPELPVAVFNDTACYAYAENTLSHLPFSSFTFININKGVGAIIVSDGVMVQGEGGMRPQLGHYSLDRNGPPCICGNRGCLENEIGESALVRRATRLGLYDALAENGDITFAHLGARADAGDETARTFVRGLAEDLAFALGNLFTIYNTNHVVIGGRGQQLGSYYLQQLDHALKAVGFRPFVRDVQIQYTALGGDAIVRGAARYFIDKFYDFYGDGARFVVLE